MDTRAACNYFTIKKAESEWLETQNDKTGYPLDQNWNTATTNTLLKPTCTTISILQQTSIKDTSKFTKALVKFSNTQELTDWEKANLCWTRMTIGVVSKQWGEHTDFGWSVCYKRGNERPFFGGGRDQ
jgi:hypothetical protein